MSIKELKVVVESIVWKFKANVPNVVNNEVKVLGVVVLFRLSDINSYYELIDVGQGKYENYLSNIDYIEVIDTHVVEGLSGNISVENPKVLMQNI